MKLFILILLTFTLISPKCTMKTKHILDYQPKVIETVKIEKINLELSESLNLEENEDFILVNVTSAAFMNDGNHFGVINGSKLAFYDSQTGKIVKVHIASTEFSDLIAKSGKTPYIDSNRRYRKEQSHFLSKEEYLEHGITEELADSFIKNRFSIVRNINDTIYASLTAYCPFVTSKSEKVYDNIPIIFKFSKDFEISENVVLELKKDKHAISRDFISTNKNLYSTVSSLYYEPINNSGFQSIPTVAKYDKKGNYLQTVSYQSPNYLTMGGKRLPWVAPRIVSVGDNVMMLYPDELTVFGENKKMFELQNLPFKNDSGFVYYQDYQRYCRSKEMQPEIDVMARLFPIKIMDAFESDNKLYPIILVWDKNKPMGFYYLIQEYTSDGKLLREVALDDEPENQIRQFAFNKYDKELVLFKKSKTSWTAEKWRMR
ncbi:MAG: hypothetical protein KGZ71_02225 [Desulfobulbaceae bacterium]|nr:hypothetical protein [Desulfobulbaceae bacterium]